MSELLNKVVELEGVLDAEIKKCQALSKAIEAERSEITAKGEQQAAKDKELTEREAAVKGIEDVSILAQEGRDKLAQAKALMAEADTRTKAFVNHQAVVDKEFSARGERLRHAEEKVEAALKDIAAREAKLEEAITAEVKKILKK